MFFGVSEFPNVDLLLNQLCGGQCNLWLPHITSAWRRTRKAVPLCVRIPFSCVSSGMNGLNYSSLFSYAFHLRCLETCYIPYPDRYAEHFDSFLFRFAFSYVCSYPGQKLGRVPSGGGLASPLACRNVAENCCSLVVAPSSRFHHGRAGAQLAIAPGRAFSFGPKTLFQAGYALTTALCNLSDAMCL